MSLPLNRQRPAETALVVDDDLDGGAELAQLLSWLLKVEASAVGGLEEARHWLAASPMPRVVVVDLHLGSDCGSELLRFLRAQWPVDGNAPLIIATSGHPDAAQRLASLEAPWVPLLPKPVRLDALASLLTARLGPLRQVTA